MFAYAQLEKKRKVRYLTFETRALNAPRRLDERRTGALALPGSQQFLLGRSM